MTTSPGPFEIRRVWQEDDGRWRATVYVDGARRFVRAKTEREVHKRIEALREAASDEAKAAAEAAAAERTWQVLVDEWQAQRTVAVNTISTEPAADPRSPVATPLKTHPPENETS